jgi:indolepyruvate decarboxylase
MLLILIDNVVLGSPTTIDQKERPLLHHTLGDYNIPKRMFKSIVVASTTVRNFSQC